MKKTFIDSQQDDESSPKAQGLRLKELRIMAQLSRKELEQKLALSANQVQSWEDGAVKGGLTMKAAKSIVAVLVSKGINCDTDWLLSGLGNSPQFKERPKLPGN